MRAIGTVMATLSLAALVAGLAWPHLAGRFLQMLIASLAMCYVGARAYRSGLPMRMVGDTYSPFEARVSDRPLESHPAAIRKLATLLGAADDGESADRVAIPGQAQRIVAAEASRRLAEYRGLQLRDPSDHARIRTLVSAATWALICPETESPQSHVYRDPVPLSHLERVLDELERL